MNDDLINEKYKRIDEKMGTQEKRINDHSKRIDKLEQNQASTGVKIDNLCDQIKKLVDKMEENQASISAYKWINGILGIFLTSVIGFFFYALKVTIFH